MSRVQDVTRDGIGHDHPVLTGLQAEEVQVSGCRWLSNSQCLVNRDRTFLDSVSQRRPFNQLQDERLLPLGLFQPVDVPNVGMVQ